jgi:excisionase family DNA binding protein
MIRINLQKAPPAEPAITPDRIAVGAKQAAKLLSISERSLWQLTKDKKIPATRVGRKWIYSVNELRRFVGEK